ncbi:hypothetical protein [Nocardia altamirensis]|uniref:hypothetical protein n=1 Tax=Nocardia altamirensis TaxID=472158 RepID=UPI00083FEBB4|nr:hypothetical protein [Nocardia altamirensis]
MQDESIASAEINYADSVSESERDNIQRSIATLVERSRKRTARERALAAQRTQIRSAAKEAYGKLLEPATPLPNIALDEGLSEPPDWQAEIPGTPALTEQTAREISELRFGNATRIFGPPFHYDWRWSNGGGTYAVTNDASKAGSAGSWAAVKKDDAWADVHAGVGVVISTETVNATGPVLVMGRSLSHSYNSWGVHASINNGDGTSEGRVELTVMENGNFLTAASTRIWRCRLSDSELDSHYDPDSGYALDTTPEVVWTMHPGRSYTLNIGAWVYVECHDGWWGTDSSASGLLQLDINLLTLFK